MIDHEVNLRFPGQYYDVESGDHYNYFRTYDPGTGRYTQPDPIGLSGGDNRFSYVNGSPVDRVDQDGLIWWNVARGIGYGGLELGRQLWNTGGTFGCVNWWDVGFAAVDGALPQ